MKPNYQPDAATAARCLGVLARAGEPLTAAAIAAALRLPGGREWQRRQVRAIVHYLRATGCRIVATLAGGYWLTEDDAIWKDYLEHEQSAGVRLIDEARRRQKPLREPGQQMLFAIPE